MATVFILDNSKHTGHAAMELDNGKYVSFRPKTEDNWGPIVKSYAGEFSDSLADDVESPDGVRPPRYRITEEVRLRGLNEEAMSHAYEHMRGHTRYQFFTMNCSTVVAKLLIVGSGHAIIDGQLALMSWRLQDHAHQFFGNRDQNLHGRLTERAIGIAESAVKTLLRAMEAESRIGARPQPRSILPLVTAAVVSADVVVRDFVWTPGEVQRLAEYIDEHLPSSGGRQSSW